MALFDRQSGAESLPGHLLESGYMFYAAGHYTAADILAVIEDELAELDKEPLSAADISDLNSIRLNLDAASTATAKLVYLSTLSAAIYAVAVGRMNETKFRSVLGI